MSYSLRTLGRLNGSLPLRASGFSFCLAASVLLIGAWLPANAKVPEGVKLHPVQELVRGNGAEPSSLDPNKVEGTPGSMPTKDMFEGLVQQDGDGNTIPAQATHWDVSPDNKTYTFHLREGIKWSNGDPVTAHDFVYSMRRLVDPNTAARYAWYLEVASVINAGPILRGEKPIEELGVKAIDDRTLRVFLEKPVPYFVKMLAHQSTFPVPQKIVEKYDERWTRPENIVTNGAYVLTEWVVNERLEMKRSPTYWDDANTTINKVTYFGIPAATAELARYKAGEMDMTYVIPLEHFKSLQKTIPDEVRVTPYVGTYYYEFNTKVQPYDDWRVRKALSLAINREAITKYVLGRGEKPAYAFTPEAISGFNPPVIKYQTWTHEERLAEAKRLIKEAGFGANKPLQVNLLYNTNEQHKKLAIVVAQLWKPLGVQVRLENKEWKTYLDARNQGRFDAARAGWIGDYNEASTMLDVMLSYHGQNKGKWSNKEFDAIMERSRLVADDEERAKLYAEAERIIANEAPVAPVFQYVTQRLVKPWVGGYPMNNVEDNIYAKDLYILAH